MAACVSVSESVTGSPSFFFLMPKVIGDTNKRLLKNTTYYSLLRRSINYINYLRFHEKKRSTKVTPFKLNLFSNRILDIPVSNLSILLLDQQSSGLLENNFTNSLQY